MSLVMTPRPTLRSFRVLAMSGHNQGEAAGVKVHMAVQQNITVGLAVPTVAGAPLMVAVAIQLEGKVNHDKEATDLAVCTGEYEAKFYYPSEVTEEAVNTLLDDHDYQYGLVAQAFPLAMTHFRRELQAMGIDAREMPLGLAYN